MWLTSLNAKENQRTTCKNVSKQNEMQNSPAFYNNEIASFPFKNKCHHKYALGGDKDDVLKKEKFFSLV